MPADIKTHPNPHRHASLEGAVFTFQSETDRTEGIDKAFDYRGDVTLTLRNEQLEGFIFNREPKATPPRIEVFIKGSDEPRIIPYADVMAIAFTGKDTADGKSSTRRNRNARPKPTASKPSPKPKGIFSKVARAGPCADFSSIPLIPSIFSFPSRRPLPPSSVLCAKPSPAFLSSSSPSCFPVKNSSPSFLSLPRSCLDAFPAYHAM